VIGRLHGTLVERQGLAVIVDVGGVGYEVHVSAHTLEALGPVGEQVTLRVFTHAQETRIALYGFASAEERALFDLLITVKNVGPSSALKILSAGAGPIEIAQMIAAENVGLLTGIKGVGRKTAELLVVELRDKCEEMLTQWRAGAGAVTTSKTAQRIDARHPMLIDVATALTQLGWRPGEVERAMIGIEVDESSTLESLIKTALRSAMQTMSR
jgi:Holliday junction DNA helicase RuvA